MVAKIGESNLLKSIIDVVGFLLYSLVLIVVAIYKSCLPQLYRPKKDVRGEIALVTGGGGGLGRLLALRLAKLGTTVVLWDVNIQGVEETVSLVKGIGGNAFGYKCDLADKDDVYKVAKKTQEEVGDVSILVNNAGVASTLSLLNTPDREIKRAFDVNIIAHFWTVKAFLPKMIEKNHGHIITIASMAGFIGVSNLVAYCSSKFAAVGFDESLRTELETHGITGVKTTVICPFFIQQTGMFVGVCSRFFPTLKSNDVADRVIQALRANETVVMIPGTFRLGISLKPLIPWSVLYLFIGSFLPDLNSKSQNQETSPVVQIKAPEDELISSLPNNNKTNHLSTSVSKLNHRIASTGKNL